MKHLNRPHIVNIFEEQLVKCEKRANDLPPNEAKAKIKALIENTRSTLIQVEALISQSREAEKTLGLLLDKVEDEIYKVLISFPQKDE